MIPIIGLLRRQKEKKKKYTGQWLPEAGGRGEGLNK